MIAQRWWLSRLIYRVRSCRRNYAIPLYLFFPRRFLLTSVFCNAPQFRYELPNSCINVLSCFWKSPRTVPVTCVMCVGLVLFPRFVYLHSWWDLSAALHSTCWLREAVRAVTTTDIYALHFVLRFFFHLLFFLPSFLLYQKNSTIG